MSFQNFLLSEFVVLWVSTSIDEILKFNHKMSDLDVSVSFRLEKLYIFNT